MLNLQKALELQFLLKFMDPLTKKPLIKQKLFQNQKNRFKE